MNADLRKNQKNDFEKDFKLMNNAVSFATKENIRNNKLILKTQQRFKRERRNDFTEEINNIALSSDDDRKIQSIDLIETYAYGTSKDLVREKEEMRCDNIIKRYKKRLTLMRLQKKKQKNIIRIGHKFLIIHIEY